MEHGCLAQGRTGRRLRQWIVWNQPFWGIAWLALLLGGAVAGADYFVAPAGNDTGPGTAAQPWRTIQKAADTAVAGDTVHIRAGIYPERVLPRHSGTANKYIVFMAEPGETVILDGSAVIPPDDLAGVFEINGREWIKVSGLRVENAGPYLDNAGFMVLQSGHVILDGNSTRNTVSSGIGVWGSHDVIVDGNEIEQACHGGRQECLTVAGTHGFEVKRNHVHDNGPDPIGGEGIVTKDGSSGGTVWRNQVHNLDRLGIYVDAWDKHTFNIEVYQNVVHDCNDGLVVASEAGGLLENIRVYDNVAYGNRNNGLTVGGWGYDGISHPMQDIWLVNNTLWNNGRVDWGGAISIENHDAQNLVVRNNLCSQNLLYQIRAEAGITGLTVDHNLIDGYRGYEDELRGTDFVEGGAKMVNPADGDFHLRFDSPGRGQGSPEDAPGYDFDGNVRPSGEPVDIGAYEYAAARRGDFDGDGVAGLADYLILAAWINGSFTGSPPDLAAMDLDGDGRPGITDLVLEAVLVQ
jgi:hypothetical protein